MSKAWNVDATTIHTDATTNATTDPPVCLLTTELTLDEVQKRAAICGLSYMYDMIVQLREQCDALLRSGSCRYSGYVSHVLKLSSELKAEIDMDTTLDHIEVRFGREVIFGKNELLEASHLPNETELISQMVIYELANVITTAICDGNEYCDVITLDQLIVFFNTVNQKYGHKK